MKPVFTIAMAGMCVLVAGCTTSSKVQEMIDASHRSDLDKSAAHEASIDVLKQSSVVALNQGKVNAEAVAELKQQLVEISATMKTVKGYADAAKLLSADNTVKLASLENAMAANKDAVDAALEKLNLIDKLYEDVLIKQYKLIAESASAAVEALQAEGVRALDDAPIAIGQPIEIVAPDTSSNAGTATNPPVQ